MSVSDYQAACKVEFQPFNRSCSQLTSTKNNILVRVRYISSPRMQKMNKYTQPNATNPLTHAIRYSVFISGVFDAGGCSYHIFHVFPRWGALCNAAIAGATVGLRRVNERNQKVLSRAIHVIFSLPKMGGVVCEISKKEHDWPSPLLLKAPHIYILDTKAILVSAVLLYTSWWVRGGFCWWVDGIVLLLLYSYIIIIPVVHRRFAATATAAAAADRWSFSLASPLAVVAVVWLSLVW